MTIPTLCLLASFFCLMADLRQCPALTHVENRPEKESPSKLRVWIKTKGMNLEYFTPGLIVNTLCRILNMRSLLYSYNPDANFKKLQRFMQIPVLTASLTILAYSLCISIDWKIILWMATLTGVALMLPYVLLRTLSRKRKETLRKELPYMMDLLSICVNAGMNIENAFFYVGDTMKTLLGKEIALLKNWNAYGIPFKRSLELLKKRIAGEEFVNLIAGVNHAKTLGTSMAKTLEIQSRLIRTQRKQRAELLSKKAAIKITFPLVFCIFPALLVIYVAPGLLQLLGK